MNFINILKKIVGLGLGAVDSLSNESRAYTAEQIETLLGIIAKAGLVAPSEMLQTPPQELTKICNGVGAEWMPSSLRAKTTRFMRSCQASAAVHDWMYHYSDATESGRKRADALFRSNALCEIDHRYEWYDVRKFLAQRKALAAYDILRGFGKSAWAMSFCAANMPKGNENE